MAIQDFVRAFMDELGPRGSTTDAERKAADWLSGQLQQRGLDPERQAFQSAQSAYLPYALATGVTLLSVFLYWQPQPVAAAAAFILTSLALFSLVREMTFQPNLLRWLLPTASSQNIAVRLPAREAPAQSLVVIAHYDSHRTPLVFSSPFWLRVFGTLTPIGIASMGVLAVLFLIGIFLPIGVRAGTGLGEFSGLTLLLRQIALLPALIILGVFALMVQADRTPYSPGAADNGSGVAVAMGLVERLRETPLQRTEVIVAFTGCEEVGCYGADALLGKLVAERADRLCLVIDQVAGEGCAPCVIRQERFLRPAPSDPGLLALADAVIAQRPELGATSRAIAGAYGELSVAVKHGLRSLALGGLDPLGTAPHWHQPTDTLAHLDNAVLARAEETAWALLGAIDGAHGE